MEDPCMPTVCRDRERHCHDRLEDTRKLFLIQIESMDKAVAQAKDEMDRRLEGMNQFRAQLERQTDTFMDKGYYDVQHKALTDKIELLMNWKNIQEGKSSWTNLLAVLAIAVSVIFGILHFISGLK